MGLPAGYNDIAYTIDIGPIAKSNHNKTICLDSSFYPPSGVWKWAGPDVFPSWDGPHCFTCIDTTFVDTTLKKPVVILDSVEGLYENDTTILTADGLTKITFFIRLANEGVARTSINNGFRIFSYDSANWGSIEVDTLGLGWDGMFDGGFFTINGSGDGIGADTVGFNGISMSSTGLPADFDERAYKITIGPLDISNHNKTICIDSSFYSPSGVWLWSPFDTVGWSGLRCFKCIAGNTTHADKSNSGGLSDGCVLSQNYPNPFKPETRIDYWITERSNVSILIYNLYGKKINSLVNKEKEAGSHYTIWNGTDFMGNEVASGIYFYQLSVGRYIQTKKMKLMK
jgi:hypothetical protein